MDKTMYLMKQAFSNFNAMKRFQTKEGLERDRANHSGANENELQKYRAQHRLELSLRALQRQLYEIEEDSDDNDDDNEKDNK